MNSDGEECGVAAKQKSVSSPNPCASVCAGQPQAGVLKCSCCVAAARESKCLYCRECKKALNNIDKTEAKSSSKEGPRWRRWCELKRTGGAQLNALVAAYCRNCGPASGSGVARGKFDFLRAIQETRATSAVEEGCKLRYMSLAKWIEHARDEFCMTLQEADAKWTATERMTLPDKKKWRGQHLFLPMPCEEYLLGKTEAAHVTRCVQETQGQRNYGDEDLVRGQGSVRPCAIFKSGLPACWWPSGLISL